jgi:hypothetical protein
MYVFQSVRRRDEHGAQLWKRCLGCLPGPSDEPFHASSMNERDNMPWYNHRMYI